MAEFIDILGEITAYHPRRHPQVLRHGGCIEHTFEIDEKSVSPGGVAFASGGWNLTSGSPAVQTTEILSGVNALTLRPIPQWLNNWPQYCANETVLKGQLGWDLRSGTTRRQWQQCSGSWLPAIVPGYGDNLWLTVSELDAITCIAQVRSLGANWQENPNFTWYFFRWAPDLDSLPAGAVPYTDIVVGYDPATEKGGFRVVLPGDTNATSMATAKRPEIVAQDTGETLYTFSDASIGSAQDNGPRLEIVNIRSLAPHCYVVQIGREQSAIVTTRPSDGSAVSLLAAPVWITTCGAPIATMLAPIIFPETGVATRAFASAWDPTWQNDSEADTSFVGIHYNWWDDDPDAVTVTYYTPYASKARARVTLTRPESKPGYSPTVYRIEEVRTPEFWASPMIPEDLGTLGKVGRITADKTLDNTASTVQFDIRYASGELTWLRNYQWCDVKFGRALSTGDETPTPWLSGPMVLGKPVIDGTAVHQDSSPVKRSVTVKTWAEIMGVTGMVFAAGVSFADWPLHDAAEFLCGNCGIPADMLTYTLTDAEWEALVIPSARAWDRGYAYDGTENVCQVFNELVQSLGLRWRIASTGAIEVFRPAAWDGIAKWVITDSATAEDTEQLLRVEGGIDTDANAQPNHIVHIGRDVYGRQLVGHVIDTDALWNEASPFFTGVHTWAVTQDGDDTDPIRAAWQEWVRKQRYRGVVKWSWDFHPEVELGDFALWNVSGTDVPYGSAFEILERHLEVDEDEMSATESLVGGVVRFA